MKKLSAIEQYLNEGLRAGRHNTEIGFGMVNVKRVDGGFHVSMEFEFSVMDGDLPNNADAQLIRVANEIEEKINGELPWLQ